MTTTDDSHNPINISVHHAYGIHSIYLAGKVSDDDWRENLVRYHPDYYAALDSDPWHAHKYRYGGIVFDPDGHRASPDRRLDHWPVRPKVLFDRYDYTGPYVTDMGHSCNEFEGNREFVVQQCKEAIKSRELVFA